MTWPFRHAEGLHRAGRHDVARIQAFLARRPVDSVIAASALAEFGVAGKRAQIVDDGAEVCSYLWNYGNIIPLGFDRDGLDEVAGDLLSTWCSAGSLVGPQDQVMGLWRRLSSEWGPARSVRETQLSMVAPGEPAVAPDPLVRPAMRRDVSLVFPASVAMYREELGEDPTAKGPAYERRVRRLIDAGRTFIRTEARDGSERVVFKADVGALACGVAQVQGVWVSPELRGQGIATAGMAAVVELIRKAHAPVVSLYVNDFNHAAVAVYRKVGFTVDNLWSTVLL